MWILCIWLWGWSLAVTAPVGSCGVDSLSAPGGP
jgi:hypothetical protein